MDEALMMMEKHRREFEERKKQPYVVAWDHSAEGIKHRLDRVCVVSNSVLNNLSYEDRIRFVYQPYCVKIYAVKITRMITGLIKKSRLGQFKKDVSRVEKYIVDLERDTRSIKVAGVNTEELLNCVCDRWQVVTEMHKSITSLHYAYSNVLLNGDYKVSSLDIDFVAYALAVRDYCDMAWMCEDEYFGVINSDEAVKRASVLIGKFEVPVIRYIKAFLKSIIVYFFGKDVCIENSDIVNGKRTIKNKMTFVDVLEVVEDEMAHMCREKEGDECDNYRCKDCDEFCEVRKYYSGTA